MLVTIIDAFENNRIRYAPGMRVDVAPEIARTWIADNRATAFSPSTIGFDAVAPIPNTVNAGLNALLIGASTQARVQCMWNVQPANYSRTNGVATVVYDYSLQDKRWLPGQKFRLAADKRSDIEGVFTVSSFSFSAGVSGTLTYADPRPDVAAGSVINTAVMAVHDVQGWSITAGWPFYANLALGGRVNFNAFATGSTNLFDWSYERLNIALAAYGKVDIVHIDCGLAGNAVNGGGYTESQAYQAMIELIKKVQAILQPRVICYDTMPPTASTAPNSSVYTTALRLNRKLCRDLPGLFGNIRIIPCGEAITENYCAFNAAPSTNVSNGWAEAAYLATDGVHPMAPWTRVRGIVWAQYMYDLVARWPSPEMGMYADSKVVNTATSADGFSSPNKIGGLWGNVAATQVTLANAGCSGNGPAGSQVTFTAGRGTSTAVGALRTNPAGGTDWVVTITGNGSASGYTLTAEHTPTTLLAELQAAQGKEVDVYLPVTVNIPFTPSPQQFRILWVSIDLIGTVGGVDYKLSSPQQQDGQFTMAAQGRAMDAGYSGTVRFPRFRVPTATYTAAKFVVTVKEINGSVASGKTVVVFGAGQKFEVLE